MKRPGLIVVLAVLLWLQIGFLPALRPFGVVPDVALVAVVLMGLAATVSQALAVALVGGLMLDVSSGSDFGLRTGILVLAALATGVVRRAGIDLFGPTLALILVAAATVVENLLILGNLVGTATQWPIGFITGKLLMMIVLNLGLVLVLRPLIGWLQPRGTVLPKIE